jgi:hypothetical protein
MRQELRKSKQPTPSLQSLGEPSRRRSFHEIMKDVTGEQSQSEKTMM